MRVAQLANFYSPTSGGLRVAVDRLRDGYRAAGDDVTLLVPGPRSSTAGQLDGSRTIEIRAPKLPNRSGYRLIVSKRAVLAALELARPDVIEVHDKLLQRWVWPWACEHDVSLVAVSHERLGATLAQLAPWLPAAASSPAARRIAARAAANCHRLIVCSQFAAAEFEGIEVEGGRAAAQVIPLGVDASIFRPRASARSPDSADRTRLISVGRLSAEKDPGLAIEALRELRRRGVAADLTLLGSGPREDRLRRQANGLPVLFAGFAADQRAVAEQLADADIALCPGPAETFGLAALEALACATPVVTVRGAATSDLVEGVPMAGRPAWPTPSDFADAVCALLEIDEAVRARAANDVARAYTWERTVASFRAVHDELRRPAGLDGIGPFRAELPTA